MDEYLPLYRAMLRATRNNTFCDTLALQEKSSYEKIHTKYCKTVLGLKKTACNISTLSELGRLPIVPFIKTQVMMYFVRINTNTCSPNVGRTEQGRTFFLQTPKSKIDKKHSYAIFPYKNNNHIFYDYSEINQKGPPVRKTLLK